MKNMREMISLMEGVMPVPGIGGSESDMQTAGTVGRNSSYAEFDAAQQPTTESVPAVDSCQQGNPADAVVACAMGESVSDLIYDQQYSRFSDLMSSFVEPQEAFDVLSREMAEQGIEGEEHDAIMQRLESDFFPDDSAFDMANGPDDFSDDADALASAGHGSDEDYGDFPMDEARGARGADINPEEVKALATMQVDAAKARAHEIIAASRTGDNRKSYLANQVNRARSAMDVTSLMYNMILAGEGNSVQGSNYSKKFGTGNSMEEAFDMQNGYNDIDVATGNDFFPNGADSPVISKVGPSGARQGDNPEQKKMQVAEVHKELVYGYRNFLNESAQATQKKKITENVEVSDLQMQDWGGDCDVDSSEASFDGGFTMAGKAMGHNGQVHEVGFTVDVKATAGVEWQEDESPTGWNHSRDEPTYTSSAYAEAGEPQITLVQFADGMEFIVDNDSHYLADAQKIISPTAMKQLLNPEIYKKLIGSLFDDRAGKIDPPEQEFDEPERDYGDSRF